MNALEKYSKAKLGREINEIAGSFRNIASTELSIYEKAIIYKYSVDGYGQVNEILRKSRGKKLSEFGKFLTTALDKLPGFDGLVYRSVNLTKGELQRYADALDSNELVKEYSFISSSKSRLVAMAFNGNVLFRIYSRTGKEIEKIAKFGLHGASNEKKSYLNQTEILECWK